MTRTDAQKELERIEEELNAKAAPPEDESRIARVNRKQPHLDAVLIGVVALLAASFLLPIIKSLNNENIDSLSAGTLGGAIGLAVGYGIGRIKNDFGCRRHISGGKAIHPTSKLDKQH